jgi:hypothetical protein
MRLTKGLFSLSREQVPEEKPLEKDGPPLYYIDVNEAGDLFIRLIHATSSGYRPSIQRDGLRPLSDLRKAIEDYMIELSADFRVEYSEEKIRRLLDFDGPNIRTNGPAQLIRPRLEHEPKTPVIFALRLYGSRRYLSSAADNAVEDGGEIFRAARRLLENHAGKALQPRFKGARAIAIVFERSIRKVNDSLEIAGVEKECFSSVLCANAFPESFESDESEVRLAKSIAPNELKFLKLNNKTLERFKLASPAAIEKLKGIRTAPPQVDTLLRH